MAKRPSNSSNNESIFTKLNTTWTTMIAGCTLLSIGFGAGFYISDVFKKIEVNEISQKHNEQLFNQKKEFDFKVDELTLKLKLLEFENGQYRKK